MRKARQPVDAATISPADIVKTVSAGFLYYRKDFVLDMTWKNVRIEERAELRQPSKRQEGDMI